MYHTAPVKMSTRVVRDFTRQAYPRTLVLILKNVVLGLALMINNVEYYWFYCHLLWTPAQRKRASMLYFANVFIYLFFMAALFSGPG